MPSPLESAFQRKVIARLKLTFPNCIVQKENEQYRQGAPDLLILFKDKWAALETKRSKDAPHRPNQGYWVERMDKMSYASFIYPENEEQVFKELEEVFR